MNTLQRNITLVAVCGLLGLSLMALRAYNVQKYSDGTVLKLNIKAGDVFTLELDENRSVGPNYAAWTLIEQSGNLMGGEKSYRGPDSTKIGAPGHAVFTFTADESGPASVKFGQRSALRVRGPFDNQKTFSFTIK